MFNLSAKRLMLAALSTQLFLSSNAVSFPGLVGPYNTSVATTQLIDHHRLDPYAPAPQSRTLMISLFYPVPPAACCPFLTSYMDPITATFEDEQYAQAGIPAGAFGSLTLQTCKLCTISASSRQAKGPKYPLVLFSSGLGNSRLLYSAMAQQYVSLIFCSLLILSFQSAGFADFQLRSQTVQHWLHRRDYRSSL